MPSLNLDSAPESCPSAVGHDPDALRLVSLACESWGAFQVIGHGVPHHVLENINSDARRLYALSAEENMKIARVSGSTLLLQAAEGFSTKSNFKLWSDDSIFCKVAEDYRKEMNSVSIKLVELMLLSLGLTKADIKRADPVGLSQKEPNYVLQLNWYPAYQVPERGMGMPHHTDSGIITVLYNNATGLQVLRKEDQHGPARWVSVPLVPDSLIVLVGDLGHILSNGQFHNITHRALVNKTEPRISVVYFWYPGDSVMVSPLVSELTGKPVYRAVTWPQYLAIKRNVFVKLTKMEEERKDGSDSELEEEKIVPQLDQEKKDGSTAVLYLYKALDSIKLVDDIEEKEDGSTASKVAEEKRVPDVEDDKNNDYPAEVEEEKEVPKVEEEKNQDVSAAGCV